MLKPTASRPSTQPKKSAPSKVAKVSKTRAKAAPTRRAPAKQSVTAPPADPAMAHWLDFFTRYHQTHALRPLTLALGPEPVPVTETVSSRYVYEVASKFEDGVEKWQMIAWEIDIPGIRLRDCKDQAEALELFARRYIYGPGVATVRLRPDFRPW